MVLLKYIILLYNPYNINQSTFHYGSIKIILLTPVQAKELLSTFHYGSIKIDEVIEGKYKFTKSTFHYGSIKIE